jgi:hypothetical protein
MTTMTNQIPKKKMQNLAKFTLGGARSTKPLNCAPVAKKYGGAHNTHNMNKCKKWDQNGNLKKNFKTN